MARVLNGLVALAFGGFVLASFGPTVKLLDLSRADLMAQGVWIGGHAKEITTVTSGGVADRAGLKRGDILEFDPGRYADWVLAGYHDMPERFSASLPVRHADGSRTLVTLTPEPVAYLPTTNDRLAYLARLGGWSIAVLLGIFLVSVRPGLMTWSLLLGFLAGAPNRPWAAYFLAFVAGPDSGPIAVAPLFLAALIVAFVPFGLSFPRNALADRAAWARTLGLAVPGATAVLLVLMTATGHDEPFEQGFSSRLAVAWSCAAVLSFLTAIAALWTTYRRSEGPERARLKWAILGMSAALAPYPFAIAFGVFPFVVSRALGGSGLTAFNWVAAVSGGILLPLALGVAVLRDRVVDIQFAVSRTLVFGAVTTLALIVLAAAHWLLGRLIEQSHLAIGLEGLAAIGLGLVLHRATHGINRLVDRLLFRRHHAAEERLRRVTAALPYASEERSIAEALVLEPVRNLDLASAALFYRATGEGPLRRVLARGWGEDHAGSLEADAFLVRYLQAEHEPLRLEDTDYVPADAPPGAAFPVLAIPLVNQHTLAAVVLYGAHTNSTLPDPDEVDLLHALAQAAATSHQQVRIAALTREYERQQAKIGQLEGSMAELRLLVRDRTAGR